jgi:hypothetical protein
MIASTREPRAFDAAGTAFYRAVSARAPAANRAVNFSKCDTTDAVLRRFTQDAHVMLDGEGALDI